MRRPICRLRLVLLHENKTLRQVWGVLETGNLLLVKLALKNRANVRWYPGRIFRSYMRLVGEERWRSRGIGEIFPGRSAVRFTVEHMGESGVGDRLDWLCYLAYITKVLSPKTVFEIGTFRGRTAVNFALNAPDDAKIYTLDLPDEMREPIARTSVDGDAHLVREPNPGRYFKDKDVATKIVQLFGDSTCFDFSPWYGKVDLVFVDGGHDYRTARSDTEKALRMVAPGGVIIWDNFAQYGAYNDVTRAVLDAIPSEQVIQIEETELAVHRVAQ
jgi:predicted O-methyltransferase YrrM